MLRPKNYQNALSAKPSRSCPLLPIFNTGFRGARRNI